MTKIMPIGYKVRQAIKQSPGQFDLEVSIKLSQYQVSCTKTTIFAAVPVCVGRRLAQGGEDHCPATFCSAQVSYPSSSSSSMCRSREEDMVVDIRVSWPSAASLDFRLQTDNSPKMKLRLDRFAMMLMLIDD